jgi:MobA/MobL family
MATYFLRARHISRGKGARATRAAAYRAGERILDERTSEVYNYTGRSDVAHKEVVLPADLAGRPDMAWTQDRATLWNAMEHAGLRRNSRLAREWLVFLPPELTPDQRSRLVRGFAAELADKYRCAIDATIHQPRPSADPRNHHAHLLMTTREVSPDGVGSRISLELGGRERHLRGLGSSRDEYFAIRERWAHLTNDALREAGLAVRVDHRSLKHQGFDREPVPTIPEKVVYAERNQGPSAAGDAIRARHRERVEARLKGGDELARVLEKQKGDLRERALDDFKRRDAQPKQIRWSSLNRAERNDRRRQWRKNHTDEVNRKQREYRRTHAAELNRQRREHHREHADELNRKRREHRKDHADDATRKQSEYQRVSAERSASKSTSPTAEESARNWKEYRKSQGAAPTAEDSARAWKEYRKTHGPGPTAEDSARNWAAFRESQKLSDSSQPTSARDSEQGTKSPSIDLEEASRKSHRDLDHDLE